MKKRKSDKSEVKYGFEGERATRRGILHKNPMENNFDQGKYVRGRVDLRSTL